MKKVRDTIIKAITYCLVHLGLFFTILADKLEKAAKYLATFSFKQDLINTKNDCIKSKDRFIHWVKNFSLKNYTTKQKSIVAVMFALAILILSNDLSALSQNIIPRDCLVVYVDGEETIKFPINEKMSLNYEKNVIEQLNEYLTEKEGRFAKVSSQITVAEGRGFGYEIYDFESSKETLMNAVDYKVLATQVLLNEEPAFFADDMLTVLTVLDEIKAPYNDPKFYKVDFKEEVTYEDRFASVDEIKNESQMKEFFAENKQEKIIHKIVSGDTLWDLSIKYEVTIDDLVYANPNLITEETLLQIDDEIVISNAVPMISVRTYERVEYDAPAPFDTKTVTNDKEYKTYSVIKTKGVEGVKHVTADIVSDNGVQTDKLIINESVKVEPITQVVEVGTMNTPPKKSVGTFLWPSSGRISDRFATRGGRHQGIDIANSAGTPIKASDGGVVKYAGWDGSGYGNLVIIDHENGYQTYYGHNSKIVVSVGQRVAQGEVIAKMGSTGRSTGNHCHFEVRVNGVPRNPFNYLSQ